MNIWMGKECRPSCEWTWTIPVLIAEFIDIVHIEAAYLNVHFFAFFQNLPSTSVKKGSMIPLSYLNYNILKYRNFKIKVWGE